MRFLNRLIATLFFSGYAPIAPGTAGTAVVAVLYWLFFLVSPPLGVVGWLVVLLVAFAVGVYTADKAAPEWGKDPGQVVVDEGVGFLFTVALLPTDIWTVIVAFFVFRVLDIIKPPPARQLEALPGGWGIVVDDVVAGIYGNLLIRLLFFLVERIGWI
ncbi:MAG: phosphatidylglycerophosphatase A [Gemmatimonadetes bacterium]|nr:phosphatidylglycerophosphatase A [Gemmatimonadota bacterium]MBT5329319.1 phosphatidylglycerophosphatase A [Gemmatimonadota bacterium]MBT5450745.1 phosphatidylglycerophosphatase A [Gemmatimonadota bacterium]MBT5800867.1 phosphatidylglycerophosphatase A [Gemmatimonadota bacterium]MBT6621614.1 phosphatidylglycerophosphatase A [Gemmatimonadota bacterium]